VQGTAGWPGLWDDGMGGDEPLAPLAERRRLRHACHAGWATCCRAPASGPLCATHRKHTKHAVRPAKEMCCADQGVAIVTRSFVA